MEDEATHQTLGRKSNRRSSGKSTVARLLSASQRLMSEIKCLIFDFDGSQQVVELDVSRYASGASLAEWVGAVRRKPTGRSSNWRIKTVVEIISLSNRHSPQISQV